MEDSWIILFRDKDTWKPGITVYETEEEAYEEAERFSYAGEAVLVQHVVRFPGGSQAGAMISRTV